MTILLLEFKRVRKTQDSESLMPQLEQAAKEALTQISQQKYIAKTQQRGCNKLIKIGIAFLGKHFSLHYVEGNYPNHN